MPKLCKEHGVPHQLNAHFGNCGGKFILAAAERFRPIANLVCFFHANA
jgi:hypothetical protein